MSSTKMNRAIEVTYSFKIGNVTVQKTCIIETYENWHELVKLFNKNSRDYKIISVKHI